jgi:hypothetical protein
VAYGNPEERGRNKLDFNKMIQVPISSTGKEDALFLMKNTKSCNKQPSVFIKKVKISRH